MLWRNQYFLRSMAFLYHYPLINKIRSFLSIIFTSYDPVCVFRFVSSCQIISTFDLIQFGDKLVEHFRLNPYYPFTCTQSYTFEYKYRRWSTIYFIIFIQFILILLTIYFYFHFCIHDNCLNHSSYIILCTFAILILFLCLNLIDNFQQRRIVLSPLDFHVSIYINNRLKQQCSIDRAYICLHQVESYNILIYHLVFIIEDIDFIEITDYFHCHFPLRQLGKCLAENLYLTYIETNHWIGIFPKYRKLKKFIRQQNQVRT